MRHRRRSNRGFSLIELLIVIAIILIIITIAVPKYNRTQMYMREVGAMAAIQTIHKTQIQYQSQYGRFAASLTELGPPQGGAPSPAGADLIGADLAQGENKGYRFTLTAAQGGYVINADPVTYGTSGSKSFYSDHTMVIRENNGPEPATVNSKQMGVNQ